MEESARKGTLSVSSVYSSALKKDVFGDYALCLNAHRAWW